MHIYHIDNNILFYKMYIQVEKDDEGFSLMNTEDMLLGRIDSKHVVRLRFPMFAKQIVYDPYVEGKYTYVTYTIRHHLFSLCKNLNFNLHFAHK